MPSASSTVNEEIPSSGLRNLSQYLAKNYKDVKGFHSRFYEHDLFHVFTPYGMYAPDGEEFEEFIRNNHCVIWLIIKGRAPIPRLLPVSL